MSVVVRMPDMRCNMAYRAGLKGVLTCPVTKKKCCGQAEIHCPIICALPEGHGRLVDADALKRKKYHSNITHENVVAVAEIDWAETIVPAERSEHERTD